MNQELSILNKDYDSFSESQSPSQSSEPEPDYPCKICLDETNPPFYPCKCNIPIHRECLNDWLDRVPQKCCDICRTEYQRVEIIRLKSIRPKKNCSPCCLRFGKGLKGWICSLLGLLLPIFLLLIIPHSEFIEYQYSEEELKCSITDSLNRYEELNYLYGQASPNKISYMILAFSINMILYLIFDLNKYLKSKVWFQSLTHYKITLALFYHFLFHILAICVGIIYNETVFPEIEHNKMNYTNCPNDTIQQQQTARLAWLLSSNPNFSWYVYLPGLLTMYTFIVGLLFLPVIIFTVLGTIWALFLIFIYLPYRLYLKISESFHEKGVAMTCCPCLLKKELQIAPYKTVENV